MLSEQGLLEMAAVIERYPRKQAAILPIFHLVQNEHGYISAEAEEWIAGELGMAPVKVHEVLTFYTMLRPDPAGRHHLEVCRTLSCELRGSKGLLRHLKTEYGLEDGKIGKDGTFSLEEVECLGACGNAPVVQIGDDYHWDLTVGKFEDLLHQLRSEAETAARSAQAEMGEDD